ncbi:MAG: hypothetical protein PHD95_07295 [Candidatus ainarchaeum sp.]|nr:hypothetical protein [Candidatus ainarchaeum sp.]
MSWEEKLIREYHKQKYREEVNSGQHKLPKRGICRKAFFQGFSG